MYVTNCVLNSLLLQWLSPFWGTRKLVSSRLLTSDSLSYWHSQLFGTSFTNIRHSSTSYPGPQYNCLFQKFSAHPIPHSIQAGIRSFHIPSKRRRFRHVSPDLTVYVCRQPQDSKRPRALCGQNLYLRWQDDCRCWWAVDRLYDNWRERRWGHSWLIVVRTKCSLSVIILRQTCRPWGLEYLKDSFETVRSIEDVRLDG